jgi:hypothetical protein
VRLECWRIGKDTLGELAAMGRNISSEALRVNVRSMIRPGSIPCETSQATRAAKSFCLARAGPRNGKNWALACGGGAKLFGVQIVNPRFGHCPVEDTCHHARRPATEGKVEV